MADSSEVISRADDLTALGVFLDAPAPGPRAMVLEGDAGIGKSTLWLAGVSAARQRASRVLISRPAESEQTLPNVVLGDLFAEAGEDELAVLPAPRRRAFESALLLREAPERPIDPRALGAAIQTLLRGLGDAAPVIIAIDDEQWVDASSAATLKFALRRLGDVSLRLLIARRTDDLRASGLEDSLDPSLVERRTLGPLSLGDTELLLRRRITGTLTRPMLARIHEVSDGNPFYALELARTQSAAPAPNVALPLAVPPSLQSLVGTRLQALDRSTLHALLLIAAHGRLPLAMLGDLGIPSEAIESARAAKVIETDGGAIRFTHPLLASTLYQGTSKAERIAAHRRLADVIDDPVLRSRHLALATDEPGEDLASALESASEAARDRGLPIAAAELAEHALRLTPTAAVADRHRRAISAARAHLAAGEGSRARTISDELLAASPSGRRRAEALILSSELEGPDAGLALREEALVEAGSAPELRAAIHAGLAEGGFFGTTKRFAWCDRHAQAALRLAERLEDDALRADALSILALLRFSHGEPNALETAERAYSLASPLPDARHVARAVYSVGLVLAWSATAEEARDWLERRLATWADRDERVRFEIVSYLALAEFRAGRWGVANDYADQVLEITDQYGFLAPYDLLVTGLVELHRGELEVARATATRALALGEGQQLEFFFAIVAMCDLWAGDPSAAVATFILAEGAADGAGDDEPTMRFWRAEYVEALLQLGRIDDAARLTADWEAAALQLGRVRVIAQAAHCRGLVAAARGEMGAAIAALEDAVVRHEHVGDPFGRARALLALGVARRRTRQKLKAREALGAALAAFQDLGAAGWAATTSAELARIGGAQRFAGLSPSELRVARLVAEGRTNREIAAALFLGERTVAGHLTRIYGKLGIRSRTELARHLHPGPGLSGGES